MQERERELTSLWPASGLLGLVFIISFAQGFQYLFSGERLLSYYGMLSLPFAFVLGALTWWALRGDALPPTVHWPPGLGFVLMGIAFVSTVYFQSGALKPLPWPLLATGGPVLAWICYRKWGSRGATLAFLGIAVALYAVMVHQVPHSRGANMLLFIEAASGELLAGRLPYRPFQEIAGAAPFAYLPALWLPYAALVKLGIDLRFLNFVLLLALALLFERSDSDPKRPEALAVTFYPLVLCSTAAVMMVHGHVWPYWVYVTGMGIAILKRRYLVAALLLGLCLAARQPALFLVPPLAAFIYREVGFPRTIAYSLVTLAMYAALVMPFALWTGTAFWEYHYFGLARYIAMGDQGPMIGAASVAGMLGASLPTTLAQAAIGVLAGLAVLLHRSRDPAWFLIVAGLAYVWLVFFAFYSIRYEYVPGFLWIALGLASGHRAESQTRHRASQPLIESIEVTR
jgi:hypothetical protein